MPKGKKSSSQTTLKTCDLCYDTLEPNQDTLRLLCEGGSECNVHHYCAGVTRNHYAELTASTTPFVCQFCALKTFQSNCPAAPVGARRAQVRTGRRQGSHKATASTALRVPNVPMKRKAMLPQFRRTRRSAFNSGSGKKEKAVEASST